MSAVTSIPPSGLKLPILQDTRIQNVLFDLGGVFYGVDYPATTVAFNQLAHDAGKPPIAFTQAVQDPIFDQLEEGAITTEVWLARMRQLLGFDATEADIVGAWNAMLRGLIPGSEEVLQTVVDGGFRAALFSNTNAVHWAVVGPEIAPLVPHFERVFTSHALQMRKPHPAAFHRVMAELGWNYDETVFIDDTERHVLGARQAGLHAELLPAGLPLQVLLGV